MTKPRPGTQQTDEDRPAAEPFVIDAEPVDGAPRGQVAERGEHAHGLALFGHRCKAAVHVITNAPERGPVAATKRATGAAVRKSARTTYTTGQGGLSWARRLASSATFGHYREQIRLSMLAGDREQVKIWTDALESAKDARQKRMLALPRQILSSVIMAAAAFGAVGAVLLICGIMAWLLPEGFGWYSWWDGVGSVFASFALVVKWAFRVVVWAIPCVIVFMAWNEGKRASETPKWLMTADERAEADSVITADGVTQALMHVKIPTLAKAIKEGAVLDFVVNPREQGGGTYFQVRLPLGVMAAELLPSVKVELLAGNMNRHRHEVWPQRQPDADARVLDCWIADKGTMDKPAPPWPLLHDGEFDVFRDRAPYGVTMRSEQISVGLLQKHWLIGATSKQGKTTAVRVLAMALALDTSVELRISDLKGDGDWSMFRERAHTLIEGQADEDAEATCVMLEDLVAEVDRRFAAKRAAGIVGPITRQISRRHGSGFHPIYGIVDECQVLYAATHPIGGSKDDARAWKAAKRLHDQARAVNVHLWQATQRPDDRTLPTRVREGAHVRGSLNVPNESTARMILADAADRGARPQDLRPGADRGTIVLTGEVEDIPAGQAFAIVRTHFVDTDACYPVLDRAVAAWRKRGGGRVAAVDLDTAPPVDHLTNVRDALRGESRVRTTVVLGRLAEIDPDTYEGWSAVDLSALLGEHDVSVRKSDGQSVVKLADVDAALTRRDELREAEGDPG